VVVCIFVFVSEIVFAGVKGVRVAAAAYEEFKIVTMNYLKSQNLILKTTQTTQTTDKHEAVVSESVPKQ
jgi:hypothetical protein